jgi:hypothetical protein
MLERSLVVIPAYIDHGMMELNSPGFTVVMGLNAGS